MLADPEEADEDLGERTCIVTRKAMDEAELIRFVRGPDGAVVPDLQRKLPGRGVWVSLSRTRVAEAGKKRLFSRGFKEETKSDETLAALTESLLRRTALGYLSLAKKAGEAVSGFMKVEEALGRSDIRVLLHAADAAPDGVRKLKPPEGRNIETINLFSSAEMDLALGRANVVHAAVAKGGIAEKLLLAAKRCATFEAS
jgi:uncharacterized protein